MCESVVCGFSQFSLISRLVFMFHKKIKFVAESPRSPSNIQLGILVIIKFHRVTMIKTSFINFDFFYKSTFL